MGLRLSPLPPPYGPRLGLGAGTACWPGAEVPRGPGWWAPLRLEHLAAHCLGSGIIAWALGATLVPQLAARTQESALCCEGLELPVCADIATGRAEQLSSAPKDLPSPPIRTAPPPDSSLHRGSFTLYMEGGGAAGGEEWTDGRGGRGAGSITNWPVRPVHPGQLTTALEMLGDDNMQLVVASLGMESAVTFHDSPFSCPTTPSHPP